jgi:DNA-binding beta-propeller fold protein YncE
MSHRLKARGAALWASLIVAGGAAAAPAYQVTSHIKGPDGGWDYSSFDPVKRRLYVSRAGGVTALEVDTGKLTAHLADAGRAHETLPLQDGSVLLITDSATDVAHIVDALSGAVLADIATGSKPDAAVFDPASGLVLVMNGKSGDATLIDPAARKAVGRIAIGGALESAVADGHGRVFVNIEDQNRIAVIDTAARAVVGSYPLAGCDGPGGLAYAGAANLLISACANGVAKAIAAKDGSEVATLAIGAGPDAVIYDPARALAFIPCGRSGELDIFAVRGPTDVAVVQKLATEIGARSGAVDPKTGDVYLPAAQFDPSPNGGRPTARPGTFEILVVTPVS